MLSLLKRYPWWFAYGGTVLFALAPLVATVIGTGLGALLGCDANGMNEGAAPDCPGGELIYVLYVSSWLALFTLPFGGLALAAVILIHLVVIYRRKGKAND